MWGTILSYAMQTTNYSLTNHNNMYNFFLTIMDDLSDEQKKKFVDNLIVHVGRQFYKEFKAYVIDKLPDSPHIKYLNRYT